MQLISATSRLGVALLFSAQAALANGLVFYVDPETGNNQSGDGSQNLPYRTITFALTQAGAADTIKLMNGVYSAASGEVFPINVNNSSVVIEGALGCGARIQGPTGATQAAVLQVNQLGAILRDFAITTGGTAVRFSANATYASLENLDLEARVGVDVFNLTVSQTPSDISIDECRIAGTNYGIRVRPNRSRLEQFTLRRSQVSAWNGYAVAVEVQNALGSANATISDCVLHDSRVGIYASTVAPTSVNFDTAHCTFFGNGELTIPASGGSIVDAGVPQGVYHNIANCLFQGDVQGRNLPTYDATMYIIDTCLVEQSTPAIPGHTPTLAPMVDPANGDFHLLVDPVTGAHPARDAANQLLSTPLDLEGNPRATGCSGLVADIGADEYIPDYVYFVKRPQLGQPATLRVLAAPGANFRAYIQTPSASPANCGATLPPSALWIMNPVQVDSSGVGSATFVATNPLWIGTLIEVSSFLTSSPTFNTNNMFATLIGG